MNENQTKDSKRPQSDFKIALILSLFGLMLLINTLEFPMSGSVGGVENKWYVSPALMPLIICAFLIACSLALLIKASIEKGWHSFFTIKSWVGDWQQTRVIDRWFVIFCLIVFVYVYVPSIDFYIATVLFLISLTNRFYYPSKSGLAVCVIAHLLLSFTLVYLKLSLNTDEQSSWLTVNQDAPLIAISDGIASVFALLLIVISLLSAKQVNTKKAWVSLLVVLIIPLILIIIFTFLLFVPMPVEYGTVSQFLGELVYEKLGIY